MKELDEILADNLRSLREALGYTMPDAALKAGIPKGTWHSFEYRRRFPRKEQLAVIAAALGTSAGALLTDRNGAPVEIVAHVQEDGFRAFKVIADLDPKVIVRISEMPEILAALGEVPKDAKLGPVMDIIKVLIDGKPRMQVKTKSAKKSG